MKKLVTVLGVFLLVGVMASPVLAWGPGMGRGYSGGGQGGGPGYCWQNQGGYPAVAPQQQQLNTLDQKFFNETATLRKNLWNKQNEMTYLLNGENPDVEKLRTLQKEISDLRSQMDEKRLTYKLEARKTAPEGTYGRGYGMGRGGYGRNGGGPRWN
jgi:Spy/CpxP family protein refolding chaperone